ncbi:hypothetical protein Asi02nite_75260 [Asanoa siamensis]|uniref:Uncharacterized protein n=1 Tax=Asanoa siamensis TaxID=926357 RepID=A0ABQ4D423_9ACTN|nr:hypothetical protein Asi02nite_75260 [Asanoa siamensis]
MDELMPGDELNVRRPDRSAGSAAVRRKSTVDVGLVPVNPMGRAARGSPLSRGASYWAAVDKHRDDHERSW